VVDYHLAVCADGQTSCVCLFSCMRENWGSNGQGHVGLVGGGIYVGGGGCWAKGSFGAQVRHAAEVVKSPDGLDVWKGYAGQPSLRSPQLR
jgi:hypothetical protein